MAGEGVTPTSGVPSKNAVRGGDLKCRLSVICITVIVYKI